MWTSFRIFKHIALRMCSFCLCRFKYACMHFIFYFSGFAKCLPPRYHRAKLVIHYPAKLIVHSNDFEASLQVHFSFTWAFVCLNVNELLHFYQTQITFSLQTLNGLTSALIMHKVSFPRCTKANYAKQMHIKI